MALGPQKSMSSSIIEAAVGLPVSEKARRAAAFPSVARIPEPPGVFVVVRCSLLLASLLDCLLVVRCQSLLLNKLLRVALWPPEFRTSRTRTTRPAGGAAAAVTKCLGPRPGG